MLTLTVKPPPSVNGLFASAKKGSGNNAGRWRTERYKVWAQEAAWQIRAQRPTAWEGPFGAMYLMPRRLRGDLPNYEKALTDLLVSMELVPDDKHLAPLIMDWHDEDDAKVIIDSPEAFRFKSTTIPHLGGVV